MIAVAPLCGRPTLAASDQSQAYLLTRRPHGPSNCLTQSDPFVPMHTQETPGTLPMGYGTYEASLMWIRAQMDGSHAHRCITISMPARKMHRTAAW